MGITKVAESQNGGGIRDDEASVAKSDVGDENSDSGRNGGIELRGDSGDDNLTDAEQGQQQERNAREEDGTQSSLPWDAKSFHDRVGKVGVQSHSRRECKRIAREQTHSDAAESRGQAGGPYHCGVGHAGIVKNTRMHDDYVRHGHDGGESGSNLGAPGGAKLFELEVVFEPG